MEVEDVSMKDNTKNDTIQSNESEPKGWMQTLGELAVWGFIRTHIERVYKPKIYIPIAIKGECLKFLGMEFIDSKILLTDKQKDLLFEVLSKQVVHSNILSGLKLLFRASDNGYDAQSFHQLCDNQANSITVIQSKNGNTFGGYLSVGFGSNNKFVEDTKAFLFSLSNPPNIYVIDTWETEYAAKNLNVSGPAYGGGFDLFICDQCDVEKKSYCKSNASSYSIEDGESFCGSDDNWESSIKFNFLVKDYEVFQFLS